MKIYTLGNKSKLVKFESDLHRNKAKLLKFESNFAPE